VKCVEKSQNKHIKDTTAEDLPDCNIGEVIHYYGADACNHFRQRCNKREQNHPDPDPAKAGFLGNHVAVPGEFYS
jgi:hypothetical protein